MSLLLWNPETSPHTTKLVYLLIPNFISLFIAHLLANFSNFLSWNLVRVKSTISSAKKPPQQRLSPIEIPYLSYLIEMSLMNKLNKIGERRDNLDKHVKSIS